MNARRAKALKKQSNEIAGEDDLYWQTYRITVGKTETIPGDADDPIKLCPKHRPELGEFKRKRRDPNVQGGPPPRRNTQEESDECKAGEGPEETI